MRIGTLVAGVLVMAAGVGLVALVIGWPALVVGAPLVFGGLVVVLVTYLTRTLHQGRRYGYAHGDQDWTWDGPDAATYEGPDDPWRGHRSLQDEDTLDADEWPPASADGHRYDPGSWSESSSSWSDSSTSSGPSGDSGSSSDSGSSGSSD